MRRLLTRTVWALVASLVCASGPACAQSLLGNGNASVVWGTTTGGGPTGGGDTSTAHATNGVAAGQVNAARQGILYSSNISIYSIGVQNNIVVTGDNNNISGNVTGTNTGAVTNTGTIHSTTGAAR